MLPPEKLDRIQMSLDGDRLVAIAELLLLVTLAQSLGLRKLVRNTLTRGLRWGERIRETRC